MFDHIKPVGITTRASEEVKKIMYTKKIPAEYSLRLGIKGGGCNGVSLIIGFDKKKDTDLVYEINGIEIIIEKKHLIYLVGKGVDFYEGDDRRGFLFVEATS